MSDLRQIKEHLQHEYLNDLTKVYNECILQVVRYGWESWVITTKIKHNLKVHQSAMEKRILGISLKDHKTNTWIREKTKVLVIMKRISSLKWQWAGHVARHTENWSRYITRVRILETREGSYQEKDL